MAARLVLPISTTQCITGATVGVGLCSGRWRAVNWKMVAWIYAGWIVTLPLAGIIGIVINAKSDVRVDKLVRFVRDGECIFSAGKAS
jgi:phosphate/sulfate permease